MCDEGFRSIGDVVAEIMEKLAGPPLDPVIEITRLSGAPSKGPISRAGNKMATAPREQDRRLLQPITGGAVILAAISNKRPAFTLASFAVTDAGEGGINVHVLKFAGEWRSQTSPRFSARRSLM